MIRGSVVALAVVFALPTLWQACIDQTVSLETAVIRFLIGVPIAAVLLGVVRMATERRETAADDRTRRPGRQHPDQPH